MHAFTLNDLEALPVTSLTHSCASFFGFFFTKFLSHWLLLNFLLFFFLWANRMNIYKKIKKKKKKKNKKKGRRGTSYKPFCNTLINHPRNLERGIRDGDEHNA
jgi:uncharacterized membrane protein